MPTSTERKRAFVIMPFASTLRWVYDDAIRPVCEELCIDVLRADDIGHQRNILRDVVEGLINSDVIIADLTGSNANVYYELGAAHSLMRPVVMLTQHVERIPFDLRSHRVLEYSTDEARRQEFLQRLRKTLSETLAVPIEPSTPIAEHMPVPFASRITQANKHARPVGDLWLYRDQDGGVLLGEGAVENGLTGETSYPIVSVHWGSLVTGWGWNGVDPISSPLAAGATGFLLRGLKASSIGDVRGTPYVRTAHNELFYFDLYMWRVHPGASFHKLEADGRHSGIIEYPLAHLDLAPRDVVSEG